ncbi:hypothetical protein GQ671_10690 [Salinicoccus hispanicus]|uniref:Uncharacterized protein n=2 Tax=Salinicoccus hispanicus TaxID=157225 RepID=A0A6N8U0Y8_9STAP|nr:hypothetical protein [Salinicoccus hispanicus]
MEEGEPMDTDVNFELMTDKLTAYQISRAVDISTELAQSIIDKKVDITELDDETVTKLRILNDKLMN